MQRKSTLERLAPLAPIDTNVQRTRPYQQPYGGYSKGVPTERPHSGYTAPYDQNAWLSSYPTPQLTPPSSAPDSGVNTPEYLSATGGGPRFNDWSLYQQYSRYQQPQTQTHATYAPSRVAVAAYHTPFTNHYNSNHYGVHNIWDSSLPDCNCNICNPYAKQPYFMSHHAHGHQIAA